MKRLARDYQELKNSKIPLVGVAGIPDEHDLTKWHVNIRGPEGSPYKGAVFHLYLEFPKDYPINPPKIRAATYFNHKNVINRKGQWIVCLE